MTDTSYLQDDTQPRKRSEMLNVLTILTFIGCALSLYFAINGYSTAPGGVQRAMDAQAKMAQTDAPAVLKSFAGPGLVEAARKAMEYRLPLLIIGLLGCLLCAWGAFQMRSLKRKGFYFYVVGELGPTIASGILIGFATVGPIFIVIGLVISLAFIGMYASQWNNMS